MAKTNVKCGNQFEPTSPCHVVTLLTSNSHYNSKLGINAKHIFDIHFDTCIINVNVNKESLKVITPYPMSANVFRIVICAYAHTLY